MKTLYLSSAEKYISLLRKYEHVSNMPISYVNEDEETEEFLLNLLKNQETINKFKGKLSNEYTEWNNWYKEVEPKSQNSNIKKEDDWRKMTDKDWEKVVDHVDKYIDAQKEELERCCNVFRKCNCNVEEQYNDNKTEYRYKNAV